MDPIPAKASIAINPRSHTCAPAGHVPASLDLSLDAPLAQQPSVDDAPLVMSPRLKIQKRGPRVLEFDEEFQRVPAARAAGIDRLSLDPPIPLKNDQAFCFLVLHSTRSGIQNAFCEDRHRRGNYLRNRFLLEEND